jgi:hypothetical protein
MNYTSVCFSNDIFFSDISLSVNRTNFNNNYIENKYGFGIGFFRTFRNEYSLNPLVGLEFNYTRFFVKNDEFGHFFNTTNVTYNYDFISIPIGIRYNLGQKIKIFLESGVYLDLNIYSNKKGTIESYVPDDVNHIVNYNKSNFNKSANYSSFFGYYIGFGISIPISNIRILIKPEYKIGINKGLYYLSGYGDENKNKYFRLMVGINY